MIVWHELGSLDARIHPLMTLIDFLALIHFLFSWRFFSILNWFWYLSSFWGQSCITVVRYHGILLQSSRLRRERFSFIQFIYLSCIFILFILGFDVLHIFFIHWNHLFIFLVFFIDFRYFIRLLFC